MVEQIFLFAASTASDAVETSLVVCDDERVDAADDVAVVAYTAIVFTSMSM